MAEDYGVGVIVFHKETVEIVGGMGQNLHRKRNVFNNYRCAALPHRAD